MLIVTRTVLRLNVMVTLTISGPSPRLVSTMRITSSGGRDVVVASRVEPAARARSPDLPSFYTLHKLCQYLEIARLSLYSQKGAIIVGFHLFFVEYRENISL